MIIAIIILLIIIYKTHLLRRLLDRMQTDPPAFREKPTRTDPRKQLESEAYYILRRQEYEAPETVKYMSNQMLQSIINEYKP